MANPVVVAIPEGAWKKVATNVLTGLIHKLSTSPNTYLQTYRLTGVTAPTLQSEGALAFENSHTENISATEAIDVYLWTTGKDGSIRADL
ncbi:hypothetical protein KA005_16795 [bacterium]|nr:hypothetical protein [bacterium]